MRALATRLKQRLGPPHPDAALVAPVFDAAFYLAANPDVRVRGADPLTHFLSHGWREGRDPTPDFSVSAYLSENPKVAAAGINPFVHFLTTKRRRVPSEEDALGFRYRVIAGTVPMAARIAAAREPVETAPAEVLGAAMTRSRGGLARLHLSFSHDDYSAHLGGVQAGVRREAARLAELGHDHLHLFPARAWQVVRTKADPAPLGVVWNGQRVGAFAPAAIRDVLREAASGPAQGRSFAIHSLLGHAADETADIVAAAGLKAGFLWLHDFASLCAGFHLLRDDVEDCAAPPPESAACSVCFYGPWRGRHLAEHERLFKRLKLTVVAPSQTTLDLWRASWDFRAAGAVVHPHARLRPRGPAPATPADRPFRLAYAGLTVAHKGWPIFRELAERFADDPRYQFLHLGAEADEEADIAFEEVRSGMQRALERHAPDAVLIWPLCRETFSFVAHEAAAAGCAILTGPDSGNVAAFVEEGGHGRVLPTEDSLAAAFENGEVLELARAKRRPDLFDLEYSALTADLLKTEAAA